MSAKSRKPEPKLVVHLGTGGITMVKTPKYAARFPQVHFVGIDVQPAQSTRPNWTQLHADFIKGLRRISPGSAHIISSDRAVGEYGPHATEFVDPETTPYTEHVLKLALQRLTPEGKMYLSVGSELAKERIRTALEKLGAPFQLRRMTDLERRRTPSTQAENPLHGYQFTVSAKKRE